MSLDGLTAAERAEIDEFEDIEDVQERFRWSPEVQRQVTSLLIADKEFLVESLSLIRPEFFEDEAHRIACEAVQSYYRDHQQLPGRAVLLDEISDRLSHRPAGLRLRAMAEVEASFDSYVDGVRDRDYYLEKLVKFAKLQAVKVAVSKIVDKVKKGANDQTYDEIREIISDALATDRNFDIGLDYFNDVEGRFQRADERVANQEFFTSGFPTIDAALKHGGLIKKEMYAWVANSGVGKSNMLVTAAVRNITRFGKRVLYVSLELDEDTIADRFDAQFADCDINTLESNRELVKTSLGEYTKSAHDSRMLVLKRFASGALDVDTLRAYIQQLKFVGFVPDMVCLDYIGEMKDMPGIKTHESRYLIARNLRRLAIEEDFCMLTAMQPKVDVGSIVNINGGAGVIEGEHLADSKAQIRVLDGAWSINRQAMEFEARIVRIFCMKHRNGPTGFTFYASFDNRTLSLTEISRTEYDRRYRQAVMQAQERAANTGVFQEDLNAAGGRNGGNNRGGGGRATRFNNEPELD